MDDKQNRETPKNRLEKFMEENREVIEKLRRISQEAEEEIKEIAQRKAEHPEMFDTEYQLEVTNRFIEENPDVSYVTIKPKKDEERR